MHGLHSLATSITCSNVNSGRNSVMFSKMVPENKTLRHHNPAAIAKMGRSMSDIVLIHPSGLVGVVQVPVTYSPRCFARSAAAYDRNGLP